MLSASSANQLFNIALAMSLAALATAASMELRTQPTEDSAELRGSVVMAAQPAEQSEAFAAAIQTTRPGETSEPSETASVEIAAVGDPASVAIPIAPDVSATPVNRSAVSAPNNAPAEETAAVNASVAVAGAARVPAPPTEAKLAALPIKPGIIFEDLGRKACIGGLLCEEHCKLEAGGCEVRPAYVIKLDRPAFISAVQLYAHDQVGPSRRAELLVKVNGVQAGATEVHRFGSTRTIKIGRVGQLVTIESRHQHNGFLRGGEEAVIWDVYLVGRKPR